MAIDTLLFKAANFDDGGTWAPAAVVTVGGSGLTCSGPFGASGTSTFTGAINCNAQTTTWNGGTCALVASAMTLDGTSSLSIAAGGILACAGPATFTAAVALNGGSVVGTGTTLQVVNGATLQNLGTINSSNTFNNSGPFANSGVLTNTNDIIMSGAGQVRIRRVVGPDADTTFGNTCDRIFCANQTAAHVYTISDRSEGSELLVSLYGVSSTNTVTLKRADTTTIVILKNTVSANAYFAHLIFTGGTWTVFNVNFYP